MALQIISGAFVTDPTMIVEALWFWIKMHVTIIDEFEELLISPITMIREIEEKGQSAGDCDDITMLAASIIASAGAETQIKAVFPQSDGSFAHVITAFRFPGMRNFVDFDPTSEDKEPVYPDKCLILDIES